VRIVKPGDDWCGKEATVWRVSGDQADVKFRFMGGCIAEPVGYSSSDLEWIGKGGPCPIPEAKGSEPQLPYCCEIMRDQLVGQNEDERYVRYCPKEDETGLINRKDPDCYSPISFCPWCGKRIASEPPDAE
jgi:hypothetical protein